jgi:hypothetical protein
MKRSVVLLLLPAMFLVASTAAQQQPLHRKNLVDQHAPLKITNGPIIEALKSDSATIAWSTNVKSGSRVVYGAKRNRLSQRAELPADGKGLMHRVQLKNLDPDTTYYFKIDSRSTDGDGADSSKVLSFTTPVLGAEARHNEVPR